MKRSKPYIIVSALGVLFIFLAFAMLISAVQNAEQFDLLYIPLLIVGLTGIVLLIMVALFSLYSNYKLYRHGVAGSKLRSKLIGLFSLSAILPLFILYAFSVKLLNSGIDGWFDIRISEALNNSYELGQAAIDERKKRLLRETYFTATRVTQDNMDEILYNMLETSKALEVSIISDTSAILTFSHSDKSVLVPSVPDESILTQVRLGSTYHELETAKNGVQQLRIVMQLQNKLHAKGTPKTNNKEDTAYINAVFPLPNRISKLLSQVNQTSSGFRQISYLQPQLRQSMVITLSMVLFLALIASIWLAFYLSQKLAQPINQLAEGTKEVAKGNYGQVIPNTRQDELGFLVDSFNQMSSKVSHSQQQIKNQSTYLETILANLSSGVVVVDSEYKIQRINYAAQKTLGLTINKDQFINKIETPELAKISECINTHLKKEENEWQDEVTIEINQLKKIIRLRMQKLPDDAGAIIVFDDINDVIIGQRNAAWSEVAKRLAHEIKNPLTPIQLSADRIRTKCMPANDEKRNHILDKATNTIIAQVKSLKHMVEEFSNYARAPQAIILQFDITKLLNELRELYKGNQNIKLTIHSDVTAIYADKSKLRQMFHNLIKNSAEAKSNGVEININVACDANADILIRVCDNAGGIPENIIPTVFEPYITHKEKGTGIGLAIVQRIVEEHNGTINIQNQLDGVCFSITLSQPKD